MSHDTAANGVGTPPEHAGRTVDSVLEGVLLVQGNVPGTDEAGGLRGAAGTPGDSHEEAWVKRVIAKWPEMNLYQPEK
jgi:hypothetical protein